jgi:hypothetical protein
MDLSRRQLFSGTAALALFGAEPASPIPDTFPRQAADMVQEMVIVSHGNAKRVRELVEAHPALARAAMDWGFGDWEDALGAASHVGNREIAEFLIANGARPTIFSAAMLGHLDTVKAFVAAQPGVQRIAGPHSISLLSHARGGTAAAVREYLERLGDAGGPAEVPIREADAAALAGDYELGITIAVEKGTVTFKRAGMPFARPLYHAGNREFFPAGAAAVRIAFGASTLTVRDGDLVVAAAKIG